MKKVAMMNESDEVMVIPISGEGIEETISSIRAILTWIEYHPHTIDKIFAEEYRLFSDEELYEDNK